MKILITTDLYTSGTNGVIVSVKNLQNALSARGHDVRVLTVSERRRSHKENGVYCIRSIPLAVYPDVRLPMTYRHRFVTELVRWKPDVIHSQCEFCSLPYALHISKLTGAPIVHTYHTMYEQYVRYIGLNERIGTFAVPHFIKNRMKRISAVIAPTAKMKDVLSRYGLKMPIVIIPSGINLTQHRQRISAEVRAEGRRALGISEENDVLVYVGRLSAEKNLSELLRFFPKARAANEKLVFMIVGDGPVRESLEQEAEALGIADSVIFTGMVAGARIHEYYQLGDAFICASTSETQGLTYIEAIANGLPLVCRDDPCLAEIVREGENGFSYTTEEQFLNALNVIFADREWRANAKLLNAKIAEFYDRDEFGRRVEELYCTVIEEKKNGVSDSDSDTDDTL